MVDYYFFFRDFNSAGFQILTRRNRLPFPDQLGLSSVVLEYGLGYCFAVLSNCQSGGISSPYWKTLS